MPNKRAKPDSLLEEALEALSDGLTACHRARVRRRVAELSELADAPEILTALDDLLARTSD